MTDAEKSWDDLSLSLKKLYASFNDSKNRIKTLQEEIANLKQIIQEKDEKIKNLETQEKIVKIAGNLAEDTQKTTELKLKINEYIREIDRCIAYLSND